MLNDCDVRCALLRMAMWQRALVIAVTVTGGCSAANQLDGSGTDPGNDGHDQLVAPVDGMESQGIYLLGETLDSLGQEPGYHANVTTRAVGPDGSPLTVSFDGSASLRSGRHVGADPFFDGVVLTGSAGGQVRLTVARGGSDVAFYKIAARAEPSQAFVDVCGGGDAVPLAGTWQRTGFHESTEGRFSFACAGSVAYKCTVWGYLAGSDESSLGWRAHQACTRMARGDYCANGHSHTREGTRIQIYDFAGVTEPPPRRFDGVQAWPPNTGRLFFEAAWPDRAHPAACLSRIRWQSLPLSTLCDTGDLRDPRLDTGLAFCEDLEWSDPGDEPTGALLFNESYYTDLALHIWRNGTDLVSTVRGLFDPPAIRQPFENRGDYTHVKPDGLVLRALRPDVGLADVEEIHLWGKPGDLVVASALHAPGADFNDLGFEGYVRTQPSPNSVPLNLYRSTTTGDLFSTVVTPPADYALVSLVGYVLPPESD
jgi:hypothetical protein